MSKDSESKLVKERREKLEAKANALRNEADANLSPKFSKDFVRTQQAYLNKNRQQQSSLSNVGQAATTLSPSKTLPEAQISPKPSPSFTLKNPPPQLNTGPMIKTQPALSVRQPRQAQLAGHINKTLQQFQESSPLSESLAQTNENKPNQNLSSSAIPIPSDNSPPPSAPEVHASVKTSGVKTLIDRFNQLSKPQAAQLQPSQETLRSASKLVKPLNTSVQTKSDSTFKIDPKLQINVGNNEKSLNSDEISIAKDNTLPNPNLQTSEISKTSGVKTLIDRFNQLGKPTENTLLKRSQPPKSQWKAQSLADKEEKMSPAQGKILSKVNPRKDVKSLDQVQISSVSKQKPDVSSQPINHQSPGAFEAQQIIPPGSVKTRIAKLEEEQSKFSNLNPLSKVGKINIGLPHPSSPSTSPGLNDALKVIPSGKVKQFLGTLKDPVKSELQEQVGSVRKRIADWEARNATSIKNPSKKEEFKKDSPPKPSELTDQSSSIQSSKSVKQNLGPSPAPSIRHIDGATSEHPDFTKIHTIERVTPENKSARLPTNTEREATRIAQQGRQERFNFKDLEWQKQQDGNWQIDYGNGKIPAKTTKANIDGQTVNSHQIEFPGNLGTETRHFSFPARDANGKNKDNIVVSYNNGNLSAITVPKGLAFDKAGQGYYKDEHGAICSVPISQNKYNQLCAQLKSNIEQGKAEAKNSSIESIQHAELLATSKMLPSKSFQQFQQSTSSGYPTPSTPIIKPSQQRGGSTSQQRGGR